MKQAAPVYGHGLPLASDNRNQDVLWAWWPGSFFSPFCEHLRGLAGLSLPAGLAAGLCPGLAVWRRGGGLWLLSHCLSLSLLRDSEAGAGGPSWGGH